MRLLNHLFFALLLVCSLFLNGRALPHPDFIPPVLTPSQLNRLEERQLEILTTSTLRLWDWIHASSDNAGEFSSQALSLKGKWNSVQSWLPWGDKNADRKYMEELFHQKFFHPTDLEQIIQEEWIYTQLRWNEAENLTLIENGMMDDAHQGNSGFLMQSDDYIIIKPAGSHQRLPELKRVQSRNQSLAIQSAGQLVVSEVASEIVARALTRVAISMGIITTGAGSSAYTFGAGAILGLIIDQCYSWIQNPEGELEEELIQAIGLLADEVTDSYQRLLSEQLDQRMDALRQIQ